MVISDFNLSLRIYIIYLNYSRNLGGQKVMRIARGIKKAGVKPASIKNV
jgi:hypothetical protein